MFLKEKNMGHDYSPREKRLKLLPRGQLKLLLPRKMIVPWGKRSLNCSLRKFKLLFPRKGPNSPGKQMF
jgi:hypothetical protein